MTLQQLQSFKEQITKQLSVHRATPVEPGLDLAHANSEIELIVGLNLMTQLILMEEGALAAPPGMLGPGI